MHSNLLFKSKVTRQLITKRFHSQHTSNSTFDFSKSKINHVAVAVPDLDQSIDFYKNVLGATVSPKEVIELRI